MNREPIDLRLPRRPAKPRGPIKQTAVLDGAFASLTDADLRLDQGASSPASAPEPADTESSDRRVAPELVASLRSQLEAIESQRGTLQRLLDGLEG